MSEQNTVEVSLAEGIDPSWQEWCRGTLLLVLEQMQISDCEISLLLCHDTQMKDLNSSYRGLDKTTDVLSFCQLEDGSDPVPSAHGIPVLLGDLVISLERAELQAAEWSVSVKTEVLRLLIHGTLHLLGYDHEIDPEEAEKMRILEERLLTELEEQVC